MPPKIFLTTFKIILKSLFVCDIIFVDDDITNFLERNHYGYTFCQTTAADESIYDIPLRVTYYARVSSESDEQRASAATRSVITRISSGRTLRGHSCRDILTRDCPVSPPSAVRISIAAVDDAETGKFDLVITKEISRFARNTLDSIQYTRQLLNAGVGVFFQNDNINTFDEDSELRLSIMSSIAQDELRSSVPV